MVHIFFTMAGVILGLLLALANILTVEEEAIVRHFDASTHVHVETFSADCRIETGPSDGISLELVEGDQPNCYNYHFTESGSVLTVTETLLCDRVFDTGSIDHARMLLTVPPGTTVDFISTTGDFYAGGPVSGVSAATTTGDVVVTDPRGELDLQSATGDVTVELAGPPRQDISVKSTTGTATVDFNGHPVSGAFEFTARADQGRITAPFDFETEEEYEMDFPPEGVSVIVDDMDDDTKHITVGRSEVTISLSEGQLQRERRFIRKTCARGRSTPLIRIETATGKARLRE